MTIYKDAEEVLAEEILVPRQEGVDPHMVLMFPVANPKNATAFPLAAEDAPKMVKTYLLRYEIWTSSSFGWIYRFAGIEES
jgi:hypothetical protein